MLLSKAWESYEADKSIIGKVFSLDENCINWSNRSAIVHGSQNEHCQDEIYYEVNFETS
ncbi:hypothetical protein ACQKP0_19905 [Heyndrickxia sp. NPDC080065]|uniref:hypothetical protein n=1 Tax=Heyndrickxia sp. NPDC080065 TaxID=3390568 RepID=UPI003D055446